MLPPVEILAPAGDRAALEAAVRAGADAVYFGLQGLNARARAANFTEESLPEVMATLHEHGVKGYLALNTLVFDDELVDVERRARAAAAAGVDAVIVQDLGVARLVRAVAPTLAIHASTQMTCTDAGAVELARSVGATRVVLARELSVDEIAAIARATDVELEVFVHGALCIAYSGQCLTSEALGNRSANRGACAQACRLPYGLVVDGVVRDLGDRAYLLSPEDLEASRLVPDLVRAGVRSLKIEGRLKGPDYVAAATRLYREAVAAATQAAPPPSEETRRAALLAYSRGSGPGFLAGTDHQRLVEARTCEHRGLPLGEVEATRASRGRTLLVARLTAAVKRGDGVLVEGGRASAGELGGRVWAIEVDGRDVPAAPAGAHASLWLGPDRESQVRRVRGPRRLFLSGDPAVEKQTLARLEQAPATTPIDVQVMGAIGEPAVFEAVAARNGVRARVVGDAAIERASSRALDEGTLRDKLGRLGDTPFALGALTSRLPADSYLPVASLNRARRALVEALLTDARSRRHEATSASAASLVQAATSAVVATAPPPAGLFLLCRTREQASAAIAAGADGVYLDFLELTGTGEALRALRAAGARFVGVAPPRIRKPGEEKIDRYLAQLAPDAVLVRGLGALHERQEGPLRVGDFSLNVTNRLAAADVLGRGLAAFTPSFDLDGDQLCGLLDGPLAPRAEVVVHHPMPLFHMEHCVIAALVSDGKDHRTCGRPCEHHQIALRDRAGMDHPVEADVGCRNTVFHAAPQSAASLVPRLVRAGVQRFRIELVRERADEIARIVTAYRSLIDGRSTPRDVRGALRTASGYGVVSGSLRVLA